MKRISRLLFSLLLTFVTLAGGMAYQPLVASAEGEVPVSIMPDAISVAAGYDFPVKVEIGDVTEFHAVQYDIYFNPAVLSITDITPGNINGKEIPVMMNEITSGHYRIEQDLETENATGSGFLSVIHFHAIQNGTSVVDLDAGLMSSINDGPITAIWNDGAVTVEDITMVNVDPQLSEVNPGDDFTVDLNISSVTDLSAVQYDIHFDPAVMTLTTIDSGTIGGTEVTINGTNGMRELAPGFWRVVQHTGTTPATGTGNLATIHFHADQLGSSPVDITDGLIAGLLEDIPATWLPGGVHIVEVTKILTGIAISPLDYTMDTGQTVQYSATGYYDDESEGDITATVTWNSTNPNVATITASGMASATTTPGTTTISASKGGFTESTSLTTEKADLVSIAVTPTDLTLAQGLTQQYTAMGTYADTEVKDITSAVQWSSSVESVASISLSGLASALAEGTTNITAQLGAITSTPEATLTVQISTIISLNDGQPILLSPGQVIEPYSGYANVDGTIQFVETGVPLTIKNLPAFDLDDGFATFDFEISWNPEVMTVNGFVEDYNLSGWSLTPGVVNEAAGTWLINGTTATNPATEDFTLIWIGITATDNPGASGDFTLSIIDFQDSTGLESGEIEPRVILPANVQVVSSQAITSITDSATDDSDRTAFIAVNIDNIINPADSSTVTLAGGLGSFEGQITLLDGGIEILGVEGTTETGPIIYNETTGVFSVASVATPMQPHDTTVAKIYVKLTGDAFTTHTLQVTFTSITAVDDPGTNVASDGPKTMQFLRGDANFDGEVKIGDALRIARFRAELEPVTNIMTINSASVLHDTDTHDNLKIGDALAIAQYRAELKDEFFVDK